ncbi:MAG: hypothetical protein K2N88_07645 [Muribaculaceae bacterium]|nr:hypothetical protein [Muribaculaceae bacterium]
MIKTETSVTVTLIFPGTGSVLLTPFDDGIKTNEDERRAIRWHLGGYYAAADEIEDLQIAKKSDLYRAIRKADRSDASGKHQNFP